MKIRFEYSYVFDLEIAEIQGKKLDEDSVALVEGFIPKLNSIWDEVGQNLIDKALVISGLSFKQNEAKCILTVSDFVSISHPFIVNVKKYLKQSDMTILVETIFHEVLHILLTDNWQVWPTNLIEKHASNDDTMNAHLHLMSIQRAVHESFKNHKHLERIDTWYGNIGGSYDETWKKISSNNLSSQFLKELKDNTQWALRD